MIGDVCLFGMLVTIATTPTFLIMWVVKKIRQEETRKAKHKTIVSAALFLVCFAIGIPTIHNHEYKMVEVKEATCEDGGYELYRCSECGHEKKEKIEKIGHDMAEVSRVEPTEDEYGNIVLRCARCGVEETEVLKKLESKVEEEAEKEPEKPTEDSHEVSSGAQIVLAQIAEDMAKQVAQNPSTVKMSIFSQGFYKDGHTYAVQSDFSCSNLMGVKESHTIEVIAVSNEDESKISPTEVYLDGELIWVRDE